jgi:hypothetical protein
MNLYNLVKRSLAIYPLQSSRGLEPSTTARFKGFGDSRTSSALEFQKVTEPLPDTESRPLELQSKRALKAKEE